MQQDPSHLPETEQGVFPGRVLRTGMEKGGLTKGPEVTVRTLCGGEFSQGILEILHTGTVEEPAPRRIPLASQL